MSNHTSQPKSVLVVEIFLDSKSNSCIMNIRAHVIFAGRVQGVWFRANTHGKANDLGLTGWVKNLPDDSVEAVFEGKEELVKEAINWCRGSQPHARVDSTEISWEDYTGEFHGFEIRY